MTNLWGYFLARASDSEQTKSKRAAYSYWFKTNFPATEFDKEDRLFYHLIEFADEFGQPLTQKYIDVFVETKMREVVIKNKIKVDGTEDLYNMNDLSAVENLMERTTESINFNYQRLLNEGLNVDDFVADVRLFLSEQLTQRTQNIMATSFEMMQSAVNGKVGAEDSSAYLIEETTKVKEMYDVTKLEELVQDIGNDRAKRRMIAKFGIPALDNDTGGLYSGRLYGVEADAGFGKTKFALGVIAYNAAVNYKSNVVYYALEQAYDEIEANLVARHCYYLYQKIIAANLIINNEVPENLRKEVEAARMDLFESGKYGKIYIYGAAELYLETFLQKIKQHSQLNGKPDIVIIDYMALIEQAPAKQGEFRKNMIEYEVVRQAYRKFKRYVLHNDICGIAINQLNAEGAEKARKGQDITTSDAQGGKEVYRSSDYNIAIVATPDMEAKGLRELMSPKKRNSKGLGRVLMATKLECCLWKQKDKGEL